MDAIVYFDQLSGLTSTPGLYVQLDDAADTKLPFTEGTGEKLRRYAVTEAAIEAAGVASGTYRATVRLGDYAAPTVADDIRAVVDFDWTGTTEVTTLLPADLVTEGVSTSRTFLLVPGPAGLISERRIAIHIGTPPSLYAVEFQNDATADQKILSVGTAAIIDGVEGGLLFGAGARDGGTQAKLHITAVTPGEYTARIEVTYAGGGTGRGDILIEAVE